MKKEEVVSTSVMTLVCFLVLIGFTVAWFTLNVGCPTVLGMQMFAGEKANVKITLESAETNPDAEDVAVLAEQGVYADIGLEELINIENGKLAPGAFGKMTFYVSPKERGIEYCEILPEVWVGQNERAWYPGAEDIETPELKRLYEITKRHLVFFSDEKMTQQFVIEEGNPLRLIWTDEESDALKEKQVVIYWKWYYEYPFTADEMAALTEEEQKQKIDQYDEEDTMIGNGITEMKFHVVFSAK